jgi:hypothetical protein
VFSKIASQAQYIPSCWSSRSRLGEASGVAWVSVSATRTIPPRGIELQLPDDAAPTELVMLMERKNYKYSAPMALDTANPF